MSKGNCIPNHWQLVRVGDYVNIVKGKKPKRVSSVMTTQYSIPYVNIKAFEKNLIEEYTDGEGCVLCEKGDFLMVWDGSRSGYVGKAINGALGSTLVRLNFPNIDIDFAYYFLQSKYIEINTRTKGVGIPHVDPTLLFNYLFPIPPLQEQKAIVSKIEELLCDLENGKQQLLKAQQQLKVYRQSLLKAAFEGKLTNKNVNGGLPEGWRWVKAGDIINTINNGYTPKKEYLTEGHGEIPFIKVYNLNFDGTINFKKNPTFIPSLIHKKELKRSICLPGDILINIVGPPLGKVSIVSEQYPEWNINQAIVMFRPNERILSKYLAYYLQNPITINWLEDTSKATAGQWNVKVSTCRTIPIPLASLQEQKQIIQELESRLTVCNKIEETINQSLQQAETLRQSILKKAFEGRLVDTKPIINVFKPKNESFYQMQILGMIAKASKQKQIQHGEMTLAKYSYFIDKIHNIPTNFKYERLHLGPYPPAMKRIINNKNYFKKTANHIDVINEDVLFKSHNPYSEKINSAVTELAEIFSKYNLQERPHKTELLATVCKVIEDIQTMDFHSVRKSMKEWIIDLEGVKHRNKAEKFSETETEKCLAFIKEKGWDKKLIRFNN